MIAFGIDPGSIKTGFGVVRAEGNALQFIDAQVIRLDGSASLADRLRVLFERLTKEIDQHAPDQIFLESVFHQKNVQSAIVLGQARGVALLAASVGARFVGELSPAEVKKAVTGRGNADKRQVQEMVRVLLGLKQRAAQDASDALAIAIAGVSRTRFDSALQRGKGASAPFSGFGEPV